MRDRLRAHADELGWWAWLVVRTDDGVAVGSIGLGGRPNAEGAVVVGYATYPTQGGRGYATEAALALVSWAFAQPDVRRVCATIPAWNTSSLRVAEKLGMLQTGTIWEEELGEEVGLFSVERHA